MHHKCGYTHAMDGTNKVRVLAPRLISRDTEDTMQLGPREYKLTGYHRVQHQAHKPLNTMIRWTGGEQGSAAFQHLQPAGNYHRHRQGGAGLNPEGYQEAVSLSSTWKGPGMTDHGPDEPRPQRVACDGYGGDMDYTQNSARAHREPMEQSP